MTNADNTGANIKVHTLRSMLAGLTAFATSVLENRGDEGSVEWTTVAGIASQCLGVADDVLDMLTAEHTEGDQQ